LPIGTPSGKFANEVKEAGHSTHDGVGNWARSSLTDLVQGNDNFKTGMIGTPEQIAERMIAYKEVGVGLILMSSLNFHEEMQYFGKRVLPLVREFEADAPVSASTREARLRASGYGL
jgi:FMNH2-dependent dimethyl sulfone monooxygenase